MRQADDAISLATAAVIAGERCRILWQSVLLLALYDAARGDERAEAWLDTESCRFICDAAGVAVSTYYTHREISIHASELALAHALVRAAGAARRRLSGEGPTSVVS